MPKRVVLFGVSMAERLEAYIIRVPIAGCWLYTAGVDKDGYGKLGLGHGKTGFIRAHRGSWEIHRGPVPDGMMVLHRCDVPACCNPDHLFLGTNQDNQDDMVSKKRNRRGVAHPYHVLNPDWVREIRQLKTRSDKFAYAALRGISFSAIQHVLYGRTWRHVD